MATDRERRRLDHYEERLGQKIDVERYRGTQGEEFQYPGAGGRSTIQVLEFLWGLPLTDLVLAYVHGLKPSKVRITQGECTTDSCPRRVTIRVTPDDRVIGITQEIEVGYSCGADVLRCLNFQKEELKRQAQYEPKWGD